MTMTSIELQVPVDAKEYVMTETTEKVRNALLLYPSIANLTISHGKAAEILGMNKMELIQLYGSMGIPYFNMSEEEFEEELQTVKQLGAEMI